MKRRKSLNLPLAKVGESNNVRKLRRDNELIFQQLRKIQAGPFGIYSWFQKDK